MLMEFTFRIEPTPAAERVVEDMHAYSRWAECVEAFSTGSWTDWTA